MMFKKITLLLLVVGVLQTTNAQTLKGMLGKAKAAIEETTGGGLSTDEIGKGLKEALNIGVGEASDFLSTKDGYLKSAYKIPLPKEAEKISSKLKVVPGFSNFEANLVEKINRAAEDAAIKAKPIFIDAIKKMTFQDAMNLLMGNQDAATRYLEKTTYDNLYAEFRPVIIESLDKVNARSYWNKGVTAYNKLPFVSKANPDLDDYVAQKALVGLFGLVEKKEEDIRENTGARTSDLLKKVFSKQDKNN